MMECPNPNCRAVLEGHENFCPECRAVLTPVALAHVPDTSEGGDDRAGDKESGSFPTGRRSGRQDALDRSANETLSHESSNDEPAITDMPGVLPAEGALQYPSETGGSALQDSLQALGQGSLSDLFSDLLTPHPHPMRREQPESLTLEIKEGKRYLLDYRALLELRVRTGPSGIHRLVLHISFPGGREEELVCRDLPADTIHRFDSIELIPDRPGELPVKLTLSMVTADDHFVGCAGQAVLKVDKPKEVHINAGRDIIGLDGRELEELSRNLEQTRLSETRWVALDVGFDAALNARRARAMPSKMPSTPAPLESNIIPESSRDLLILRRTRDGAKFFVFAGTSLLIGRDSRDVQLALRTGTSDRSLMGISRLHCRIRLTGDAARLTDLSSAGTRIDGVRIPKKVPVRVAHGDLLSLAEILDFRTNLFADPKGITAVALERDPPQSPPSFYLLAGRGLPLAEISDDATGWLLYRNGSFCLAKGEEVQKPLEPGPVDHSDGLRIEQPSRCPSCRRLVYPLPEALTCPECCTRMEPVG